MQEKRRRWWPIVKALLGLAILAAIAWRFTRDLSGLRWEGDPPCPGWLAAAALLYLAAMTLSALYWRRLLGHLGSPVTTYQATRAYFVSQLGKYVPGKALAVLLRIGLVRDERTPASLAALTTFYEVLTTMASGALLATLLFLTLTAAAGAWDPAGTRAVWDAVRQRRWPEQTAIDLLALAVVSFALTGVTLGPLLPPVFNRIVDRVSIPFRSGRPPAVRGRWLAEGLLLVAPAWLLLGSGLWCGLAAIPGAALPLTPDVMARLTAVMGLAYVAAFLTPVPAGLGVREFLLTVVLAPDLAQAHGADADQTQGLVTLAVLLLRLVWTAAEVLLAGLLYLAPMRKPT